MTTTKTCIAPTPTPTLHSYETGEELRDAMAAAALELQARRALDAWDVEHWRDRGVMHIGGRLVAYDHRCRSSWRAPDHVTLARKMGLI